MEEIKSPNRPFADLSPSKDLAQLRRRLQRWQQVRTWARLIREAESLWHLEVRELRRIGAIELTQLLQEVPPHLRERVNRWLGKFSVSTRLKRKVYIKES